MLLVEQLALSFEKSLKENGVLAVHSKTTMGDPSLHFIFQHDILSSEQLEFLTLTKKNATTKFTAVANDDEFIPVTNFLEFKKEWYTFLCSKTIHASTKRRLAKCTFCNVIFDGKLVEMPKH
ncbi:hypothetical protein HDU92_007552, partial [Lobulomyces angularis]